MANQITFSGGLVRKGDLQTSATGNKYMFITLARNYSEKQNDGTYKEVGTQFQSATVFGRAAETLAQSNIPLGTQLFVTGTLNGRVRPAYTDKQGVTHEETFEETLAVNSIGVDLGRAITIDVVKAGQQNTTQSSHNTAAPSPASQAKQEEINKQADDIFSDFGNSPSNDDDDFDSIFM